MVFEFERDAMDNKPSTKTLDIADLCAYNALRWLYKAYHDKVIGRADATKEKEKIVEDWSNQKSKLEFLSRDSRALREKIGSAAEAYRDNPTLENAEKMYAAFYNTKPRF